jgi:hypothetical protein
VAPDEGVGLAPRPAARNRHAHTAVMFNPQQVAPCASVADEVDRCD